MFNSESQVYLIFFFRGKIWGAVWPVSERGECRQGERGEVLAPKYARCDVPIFDCNFVPIPLKIIIIALVTFRDSSFLF